jgi:hypothetical protein
MHLLSFNISISVVIPVSVIEIRQSRVSDVLTITASSGSSGASSNYVDISDLSIT